MVAINQFATDTDKEIAFVEEYCASLHTKCELSQMFAKGGEGGVKLARTIVDILDKDTSDFHVLYGDELPIREKIETVVREIYGGKDVYYEPQALKKLEEFTRDGFGSMPVCMAKTQYSLSDNPALLARPEGFTLTVRDL